MALRTLIFAGLLLATPALSQDASSASSDSPSSSSSAFDPSSSMQPAPPATTSDADLELIVRVAYTGASAFAEAHGRYFARDGVLPPLHDAIAAELDKDGYAAVTVPVVATTDRDALNTCRIAPGTELRIGTNTYGDAVSLVAVTDTRAFAYDYDPHKAADIVITKAQDCAKPK